MTLQDVERQLPIVADSWAQLRPCDLFRLLESFPPAGMRAGAAIVAAQRPDLAERVTLEAGELAAELPHIYDAEPFRLQPPTPRPRPAEFDDAGQGRQGKLFVGAADLPGQSYFPGMEPFGNSAD